MKIQTSIENLKKPLSELIVSVKGVKFVELIEVKGGIVVRTGTPVSVSPSSGDAIVLTKSRIWSRKVKPARKKTARKATKKVAKRKTVRKPRVQKVEDEE